MIYAISYCQILYHCILVLQYTVICCLITNKILTKPSILAATWQLHPPFRAPEIPNFPETRDCSSGTILLSIF